MAYRSPRPEEFGELMPGMYHQPDPYSLNKSFVGGANRGSFIPRSAVAGSGAAKIGEGRGRHRYMSMDMMLENEDAKAYYDPLRPLGRFNRDRLIEPQPLHPPTGVPSNYPPPPRWPEDIPTSGLGGPSAPPRMGVPPGAQDFVPRPVDPNRMAPDSIEELLRRPPPPNSPPDPRGWNWAGMDPARLRTLPFIGPQFLPRIVPAPGPVPPKNPDYRIPPIYPEDPAPPPVRPSGSRGGVPLSTLLQQYLGG